MSVRRNFFIIDQPIFVLTTDRMNWEVLTTIFMAANSDFFLWQKFALQKNFCITNHKKLMQFAIKSLLTQRVIVIILMADQLRFLLMTNFCNQEQPFFEQISRTTLLNRPQINYYNFLSEA